MKTTTNVTTSQAMPLPGLSAKHTPGAIRISEILIPEGIDRKGRPTRLATAYGLKNRTGLADLIDGESGAPELLAALERCAEVIGHNACSDGQQPNGFVVALEQARAAIARAEWRAP